MLAEGSIYIEPPQKNLSSSSSSSTIFSSSSSSTISTIKVSMDCSICSSMPFMLRPPRNIICGSCFEAAKNVITLMNKFENYDHSSFKPTTNLSSSPNPSKPLANLSKWVNNMKDTEDELREKTNFLGGFVDLFRQQILTDILLQPGNHGPSIPAHRAILAARSEIFKTMLDPNTCKAPANDTVSLPELNHEELEALLEFLYCGSLRPEKLEKHVYALTMAADKYEIPYMLRFCEKHMLKSLDSSNALDVIEISDVCSNRNLKETALIFIVKNIEDVVFTAKYEAFVVKNPHLAVHITRACLMDAKGRRISGD